MSGEEAEAEIVEGVIEAVVESVVEGVVEPEPVPVEVVEEEVVPVVQDANQLKLAKDRVWLDDFINDKLKKQIQKVEEEVDNIRNKKVRGALKKQKDMLKSLNEKLKLMRVTRSRCEELAMTMGFLEGGAIKPLKPLLKKYNEDVDNDEARTNVDNEVAELISQADLNRQAEDLLTKVKEEEEKKQYSDTGSNSKYGHLGWLHQIIDMSHQENEDILITRKVEKLGQLSEGMILDAQDYLDSWHLSVICKIQPENDDETVLVNFLPYPKGNRDEWISKSEINYRFGGLYTNCP